jgi:hypothetical protein
LADELPDYAMRCTHAHEAANHQARAIGYLGNSSFERRRFHIEKPVTP